MTEYEITNRKVNDSMLLEDIFSKKGNWETTNKQVKERRAASHEYLKQMIAL